jgi:hypothetical protein
MKHISIQCVCHIVKNSKRMGWKRTWTGSRSENLLERFGGWKPLLLACGNTWGKNTSNWKNVAGAKTWIKKRWTNVPLRASHHIVLPRTFRQWIKLGACVGSVARARWTVLVLLRLFGIDSVAWHVICILYGWLKCSIYGVPPYSLWAITIADKSRKSPRPAVGSVKHHRKAWCIICEERTIQLEFGYLWMRCSLIRPIGQLASWTTGRAEIFLLKIETASSNRASLEIRFIYSSLHLNWHPLAPSDSFSGQSLKNSCCVKLMELFLAAKSSLDKI